MESRTVESKGLEAGSTGEMLFSARNLGIIKEAYQWLVTIQLLAPGRCVHNNLIVGTW